MIKQITEHSTQILRCEKDPDPFIIIGDNFSISWRRFYVCGVTRLETMIEISDDISAPNFKHEKLLEICYAN